MKKIALILIAFLAACSTPSIPIEPYIGTVNGIYMPLAVYMIYLEEQIVFFEEIGGTAIWQADFGIQTAEQVAMEHALDNMALSLIIRNIAKENNISASEISFSEETYYEFFFESIAIREALMNHLTVAYAENQREEIFENMEETWLAEATIIRNVTEWDKIGVAR